MASLCKRQQCTIDRRGFRQELDSWRHKLLHCVGFESILEGLFDPKLVEDLKLFKDFEPVAVSDWSFDENCLFCCLRRDKVKEHLIGLNSEGTEDTPKPLLVKDQITISRLEKQAEEFLNAVLCRKDVPNFSDPHIPVVAREILQRMIRQFAAEYTSKTSSPQDSCSDSQPHADQSLSTPPLLSGAPPPPSSPAGTLSGPTHNPVLSKLLMADQDAPLDLTIKKPLAEPTEQDGVLDLSIKKNRYCSSLPVHSPTSTIKGESQDIRVTKAKDLQSTSTLAQFLAKLCPHHQRQIVNAIGYLQTEVKAQSSSYTHKTCNPTSGVQRMACSIAKSSIATPEPRFASKFTPKSEIQEISYSNEISTKHIPGSALSLKTSVAAGPILDLRGPETVSNQVLTTPATSPVDIENKRQGDHAPLKMKIMTSNAAAGKRLSCVLNASLSSNSDTLEDRRGNTNSSSRTETHSARLSSTLKRHSLHARQREVLGHAKDMAAKVFPIHMTISSDSTRTARKTIKTSTDHLTKDSTCRGIIDPDLGHCDIVFIDKPITECFKKRHRGMTPRRNARKSTRGHMYSDEIWELKTVRTLAGRGNCPNPMPELITLVTPKQIFSRPEGVPPLDIPFVGACRETINQEMTMKKSVESVIPVTEDIVEVAASQVDVVVKASQTDQGQSKGLSAPPSPFQSPTENTESILNIDVAQETTAESGTTVTNEESVSQTPVEPLKDTESEPRGETQDSTEQKVVQTVVEPFKNESLAETEPPSDGLSNDESVLQQTSSSSPVTQMEERAHDNKEELQNAQPQECQPERDVHADNSKLTEEVNTTTSDGNVIGEESEKEFSKVADSIEAEEDYDDCDVSSKTLNALLKELPPWRRKKGTKILLPKRMRQTETTIVGYVNGRPISASDRSLRRRANNVTPPSKTVAKSRAANEIGHSISESNPVEKPVPDPHTPSKLIETTPVIEKLTEAFTSTSSSVSKSPVRTKETQKQKQPQRTQGSGSLLSDQPDDSSSNTESRRQLRSTRQKSNGTPLLTLNAITRVAIPEVNMTPIVSLTEQASSLLSSHVPCVTLSPLIRSSGPSVNEQSRQNTVPETVEESTEDTQQAEATEEIQKNKLESRLEAKQKLRSAKSTDDYSKNEKQQLEVSSPSTNKSPVQAEMQIRVMPLRSKRVLQKESEASNIALLPTPNVESLEDRGASGDESSSSISDKPTRMPLRSENNKAEASHQSLSQSPQAQNKKSQRSASPSTSAPTTAGEQNHVRIMPTRGSKTQAKSPSASAPSVSRSSHTHIVSSKHDPTKPTPNKFYQTMTGEESQHLITNLNIRYDKMQKGWVQMDKEGQPATKYRNKSDRQAAIWKSKRRARKPKSSEHQKYSPVQMLFMKGFNLTSICRWFLESTETKSLVIVKKVNTRLPSETQLCFHSSSSASGTSQGVFPSLQAERLKKHLKKFAIASPVKSNPKSQKLIAKVLEQEANVVKGKERGELPSTTQTLNKSCSSAKARAQINEPKKSSGKSKNPASARILRKYSNIREKMQVQQTTVRLKEASKIMKTKSIKTLDTPRSPKKSNVKQSLKASKSALTVSKQVKEAAAKMEKKQTLAGKKSAKLTVQEKAAKASSTSRPSKDVTKKELPKRSSQRLGCTKTSGNVPAEPSKSKVEKKHTEADKPEVEKNAGSKVGSAKIQTKESSHITAAELRGTEKAAEMPKQSSEVKVPTSPDQVLTRSQRKMEAAAPAANESPSNSLKRATKPTTVQNANSKSAKKADEPAQTRSGALKPTAKRSQAVSLPRSASKLAIKRAQELLKTPAKRTRTSLSR